MVNQDGINQEITQNFVKMACNLNEDQVFDLYEVLYGEVLDRIKDKKLPKFDINETLNHYKCQ